MRVLFIAPLPDPVTGQSLACQILLEGLQTAGHQVEVININKASLKSGGGSLSRIREVLGFAWQALRQARRVDLIYFTISESVAGSLKDALIYLACFGRLDRMAIHLHGGAGMRVLMHDKPVMGAINRFFLRRLGAIVLLGERHLDILRDLPNKEHVHLVPNFAQDAFFLPTDRIEAKFRQVAPLRLLYLSNLIPGKGYLELLAAYESLQPQEQARMHIDFAGAFENGVDEAAFKARIAGLPGVQYHGVVGGANKARLLAEAHVFCLPTYYPYEGQPISILEAYASGCSVITTDHSGIFDVFDPAQNGIAVAKRSAPAVAEALRACIADPQALSQHAKHNRAIADERFRVATYNFRLVGLLQGLAAQQAQHA